MKINRETKIGVMVVVGIALAVFGINYLKGVNVFMPTHRYYANYSRVDGLAKSAPVRVNGYQVGLVHEIICDFSKDRPFTVVIALDNDLKIPKGSLLELADDGLLGGKCIDIIWNKSGKESISVGDTIPTAIASGLLGNLEAQLMPQLTDQVIPHIDSLLITIKLLAESQALQNSLNSIELLMKNLEQSSAALQIMMNNQVPTILAHVDTITTNFTVTSENLRKVDLVATMASLDTTINNLKLVTEKLNEPSGSAGLLINDDSLYVNVNAAIQSAQYLLEDIKANPKRYINVTVFGGKTKDNSKEK